MKNSKQKQELIDSIKEMEDVYNDADTPADIKNSLEPSIRNAKGQLKQLEQAEQQEQVTVTAEKKVAKTAPPKEKKKKAVAKKKAATTVRKVEKRIEKKLPAIRAVIRKANAALTKVKGRTARGREADASRKALPPGTRISKSGNEYREYRENRADVQRKKVPYLAQGGTIDNTPVPTTHQVDVFGYRTKYLPQEVAAEFKKAVAAIDAEPDKEGLYFHNTSEALKEFANMIDTIFLGLEAYNMKMVLAAALYCGAYNYKSGMHVSVDVLVLAMTKALQEGGKSFGRGGIVGGNDVRAHIYEKLRNAGIDTEDFTQMVADVKYDVRYGPAGLDEEYAGFVTTQNKIESMLQQVDISDTFYYDKESGDIIESEPEYDEDHEWYEVSTKAALFGDLASYFRRGGRIKSAINRDRKYKSDEPWEKSYHRKTPPKNPRYAAKGDRLDLEDSGPIFKIKLDDGSYLKDERGYDQFYDFESAQRKQWLFAERNPEIVIDPPTYAMYAIGDDLPFMYFGTKDDAESYNQNPDFKTTIKPITFANTHTISLSAKGTKIGGAGKFDINPEYQWFVYCVNYGRIVAGNEYREDADDVKEEMDAAYPVDAWKVYSAAYLKGQGVDPYDSDNWSNPSSLGSDKAARGKRLYPKTYSYNYKEGNHKIVFSVEDEAGNEIWTDQFANAQDDQANYGPTRRQALEHYHMEGIRDTEGIKKHLLEHGLIQEHDAVVLGHMLMGKGGKVKKKASFKDKVKAIKSRLSGTKVPSKYRKQYGKKYSKKEAGQAAGRIAGAMRKKEKGKAFLGTVLTNSIDNTLVANSQGAVAI